MKALKWFYPRLLTFSICFTLGTLAVVIVFSPSSSKETNLSSQLIVNQQVAKQSEQSFKTYPSPEFIIEQITSNEPIIRRNIYKELFLKPTKTTTYYDFERDLDYPERADNVKLNYVNLNKYSPKEAIITFNHLRVHTAIVMQKQQAGWIVIETLSALEQMPDTKLEDWLQPISLVETNVSELLLKKVTGDNSSYYSEFGILKLINGQLVQVGTIPIETIKPQINNLPNWQNIKSLNSTTYQISTKLPTTITLRSTRSIVEYNNTIPQYSYWSDIDNSTHTYKGSWHNSSYKMLNFIEQHQNVLEWDNQQQRFVIK